MTQNPEKFLTLEMAAAIRGETLATKVYLEGGGKDLKECLRGGVSVNWEMMRWATRLVMGDPDAPLQWKGFFEASRDPAYGFMGDEPFSAIYKEMHIAAVLLVAHVSQKPEWSPLRSEAAHWLTGLLAVYELCETYSGRIMLPGFRSAGHEPGWGLAEWTLAVARGLPGSIAHAEEMAHERKLGLKGQWLWYVQIVQAALQDLQAAYAPLVRFAVDRLPELFPYPLVSPLHVIRTPRGVAAHLEHGGNPNTPALMVAVDDDGTESFGPAGGGDHWREHPDIGTVTQEGDVLHYRCASLGGHYPDVDITIPGGERWGTVLGAGAPQATAGPTPQPTPQVPEQPATPTPAPQSTPGELADALMALTLSRSDQIMRRTAMARLLRPPAPDAAERRSLAALVRSFGVNVQGPQAGERDRIAAEIEKLGTSSE